MVAWFSVPLPKQILLASSIVSQIRGMSAEFCDVEEDATAATTTYVSIPRGGPLYVSDMVGPFTRAHDFESTVFHLLEDLKAELEVHPSDSLETCDEDISVDELKIITEEELVNKAFEEAFKDGEITGNSSQVQEEHLNAGQKDESRISSKEHACSESSGRERVVLTSFDSSNGSLLKTSENRELSESTLKKRMRKRCKNQKRNNLKKNDIAKVEQLASIKQKQDDDKAAAGLHSSKQKNDCRISNNEHTCSESSGRERNTLTLFDSSNGSLLKTGDNGELGGNTLKKRKRKSCMKRKRNNLQKKYIAKVEQLARIKQKQDEDKAAARLHSFNGRRRRTECASIFLDKADKSIKSTSASTKARSSNARELIPLVYPEAALCVDVYHNRRTWIKTQEFLVLGRQFLTELRDKIYCATDEIMKKAEQHDPSGYFLIEGLFCNDLRESSAIDYSEPIFDWLENSKSEAIEKWEWIMSGELQQKQKAILGSETEPRLPKFKAVNMHQTRFCDLRFRLGAGYLYCHQGDCKHVIVFRDMRLIHPEDVQNRAAYPIITFQAKLRFRKCSVCKIYRADKVTVDDKWAAENPCYFCDVCYYMLHYQNGSLLYNEFSVYDYHHD